MTTGSSGFRLARAVLGNTITAPTATKRAIDRLAHRVYTSGKAQLQQLPLRTLCFLLETRPDGLFLNLGVALVGGTLTGVTRLSRNAWREAWRFGTMSHEVRKADRRASKGDYQGAMEVITELAAKGDGAAQEAAQARRRVALAMARGIEAGNRGGDPTSLADYQNRSEQRAGLYKELLGQLRSAPQQQEDASLARYNARSLALIKRKLQGVWGVGGQIKKAVKAGHPWEVEAAYALLEGAGQELDRDYAIANDSQAAARRSSDLRRATYELADRAAFDAFTMSRHPERYAGPDQDGSQVLERAAAQLDLARRIVAQVESEHGGGKGSEGSLARHVKNRLRKAEDQLDAGLLTRGRQRVTDLFGSTTKNLAWILWTWIRHGALLMPQGQHVNGKMEKAAVLKATKNRQETVRRMGASGN